MFKNGGFIFMWRFTCHQNKIVMIFQSFVNKMPMILKLS